MSKAAALAGLIGISVLCGGGAALAKTMPANLSVPNHDRRMVMLIVPRRRKTKRRSTICALLYKQATPLGFLLQANFSQAYVSPSKMLTAIG